MRNAKRLSMVSIATLAALPVAAQTAPNGGEKQIRAKPQQEVELSVFANINPDCTGLPAPQIGVAAAPTRGMLIVRLGVIRVPDTSPQCAGRRVPALSVVYRAESEGSDTVRLQMVAGQAKQSQSYSITNEN